MSCGFTKPCERRVVFKTAIKKAERILILSAFLLKTVLTYIKLK